eukprot:958794-Amphidinium_carterae.1
MAFAGAFAAALMAPTLSVSLAAYMERTAFDDTAEEETRQRSFQTLPWVLLAAHHVDGERQDRDNKNETTQNSYTKYTEDRAVVLAASTNSSFVVCQWFESAVGCCYVFIPLWETLLFLVNEAHPWTDGAMLRLISGRVPLLHSSSVACQLDVLVFHHDMLNLGEALLIREFAVPAGFGVLFVTPFAIVLTIPAVVAGER